MTLLAVFGGCKQPRYELLSLEDAIGLVPTAELLRLEEEAVEGPARLWIIEREAFDRFVTEDKASGLILLRNLGKVLCRRVRADSDLMLRKAEEMRTHFLDMAVEVIVMLAKLAVWVVIRYRRDLRIVRAMVAEYMLGKSVRSRRYQPTTGQPFWQSE